MSGGYALIAARSGWVLDVQDDMAHAILAILLASAIAATFVGRRANNALSQGRCLVPWILA
jgi:hypothetical protein